MIEQLVSDIYDIIKDYRLEDGKMSIDRINKWIKQFVETEQEFILSELKHILSQRYFSKETIQEGLEIMIKEVMEEILILTHEPS